MNIKKLLLRILSGARAVASMAVIVILVCATSANGQSQSSPLSAIVLPPVQVFPWGSVDAVTQFAVTNTRDVTVTLYQGNATLAHDGYEDYSFSNLTNVMDAFQQSIIFGANEAMTNSATDKNAPIFISGSAINLDYPPGLGLGTFLTPWNPHPSFNLINSNGTWVLPDLTGIQASLFQQLPFYVPGLLWGRIEIYYTNDLGSSFLTVDSRYPASSSTTNAVNVSKKAITLVTDYLTSGTSGPYRLKVSLLTTNGFSIVDGDGMLVVEKPLVLQPSVQNNTFNVAVTGGDPGRVFALEETTDLVTWSQLPGTYTVGTNADWSATVSQPMKTGISGQSFGYYRAVKLNAVPTQ